MDGFTYTPFGFDELPEHSYFCEAFGDMRTPTFGVTSPQTPLDNKQGENYYFDTAIATSGETYKSRTARTKDVSKIAVCIYQDSFQAANNDLPLTESYELSSLGYSEDSFSSNSTAATPDLTYADDSPEDLADEVEGDDRADQVEEAEALNQIIKRKRKTRASSITRAKHDELVDVTEKESVKNHKKAAATDTGIATSKKKRGRQPKLHKTKADKDAAHAAFLERNRVAAHKCREKKRVGTVKQQKDLSDIINLNADLRAELASLLSETHTLIQTLLPHANEPCTEVESKVGLESAQEKLWTAEGTLLEMSLLRQQVGILAAPDTATQYL